MPHDPRLPDAAAAPAGARAAPALLRRAEARLPRYLADLEALVRLETPSGDLPRLERAADWLERAFSALGPPHRSVTPAGPLLRVDVDGAGPGVLLLCHYDTVHPAGSWPEPWRVDDARVWGPGTNDMKGGVLFALHAPALLREAGLATPRMTVLITPDEETGSEHSRATIEAAASDAAAVLVLEAPTEAGDPKVARKGAGRYRLLVHGKAAHQGVEPEKGVNAVLEIARQVVRLPELGDERAGTILGPNVVRGGTALNVVADRAEVEVDVRAWTAAEGARVDAALRALRPVAPGARLELRGGFDRPPMEPGEGTLALFERVRSVGAALGLELAPGRVGGGSDGNFTAAMGVPTLDGLGPLGFEDHQRTEHVMREALAPRLALFAGLLHDLAPGGERAGRREGGRDARG